MKFTPLLIETLKNFSLINESILFKEGNKLSTVSKQKSIMASCVLDTEITQDFAIYDLHEFLGILSSIPNCDASFDGNQIILSNKNIKVKYTFAHESTVIASTYKDIPVLDENVITEFELSYASFNNILKACSILKIEDIVIEGSNNSIEIKAMNAKNKSSNSYNYKVENVVKKFSTDFKKSFKIDSFKLKDSNYTITIPKMNLIKFTSMPNKELMYWVAAV